MEEEINQLKGKLILLKNQLMEIQKNCDHHFQGNLHYETCTKCNKVNVLYY